MMFITRGVRKVDVEREGEAKRGEGGRGDTRVSRGRGRWWGEARGGVWVWVSRRGRWRMGRWRGAEGGLAEIKGVRRLCRGLGRVRALMGNGSGVKNRKLLGGGSCGWHGERG